MADAQTFVPVDLSTFPPRRGRKRTIDIDAANALVTLLIEQGSVGDGVMYEKETLARVAAAKAKRLAEASTMELPKGKVLRTRVGTPKGAKDGLFAYALFLGEPPANAKSK